MGLIALPRVIQALNLLHQHDFDDARLKRLLASGLFSDVLEAIASIDTDFSKTRRDKVRLALGLARLLPEPDITELGELSIADDVTPEGMLVAYSGVTYNYPRQNITSDNFPITHRGPSRLSLIHFKRPMSSEEVKQEVAAMDGKALASVGDLCAVNAHPFHTDWQRQFPIICLGYVAVLQDTRHVLCLDGEYGGCGLDIRRYDDEWEDYCRFLLVNK